jgi:hypothetical protein
MEKVTGLEVRVKRKKNKSIYLNAEKRMKILLPSITLTYKKKIQPSSRSPAHKCLRRKSSTIKFRWEMRFQKDNSMTKMTLYPNLLQQMQP